MPDLSLESIVCKRYKQTRVKFIFAHIKNKLEDNIFKIGDAETKISVPAWNGSVRVHFRKFNYNRRQSYPSHIRACKDIRDHSLHLSTTSGEKKKDLPLDVGINFVLNTVQS